MQTIELSYDPSYLPRWRTGELAREWRGRYPFLFTSADWECIKNQVRFGWGFSEWFVALHYQHIGFRSLIAKYVFPRRHPHAAALAESILGPKAFELLRSHARTCQPPDLLVFHPEEHDKFFFAEVKRDTDRLKATQTSFFTQLESLFNREVVLVRLRRKRATPLAEPSLATS